MNPQPNAFFRPMTLNASHDDVCTWQLDEQAARLAAREHSRTATRRPAVRRLRWTDVLSVVLIAGAVAAPLFLSPMLRDDDGSSSRQVAAVNPPAR